MSPVNVWYPKSSFFFSRPLLCQQQQSWGGAPPLPVAIPPLPFAIPGNADSNRKLRWTLAVPITTEYKMKRSNYARTMFSRSVRLVLCCLPPIPVAPSVDDIMWGGCRSFFLHSHQQRSTLLLLRLPLDTSGSCPISSVLCQWHDLAQRDCSINGFRSNAI